MTPPVLSCPSPESLTRALSAGPEAPDESLRAHLGGCDHCRGEWQALSALLALTRQISVPRPDRDRVEAVRTALLTSPRLRPRHHGGRFFLGATLAMAAVMLLAVFVRGFFAGRRGAEAVARSGQRGTVLARGMTRFIHEAVRPDHDRGALRAHDEVVRLSEGEIRVEVAPLRAGERFRVLIGTSEVEVQGTAFDVTAHEDRLEGVRVLHGRVEVRPAGQRPVWLRAGETWQAAAAAQAPALPPADKTVAAVEAPRTLEPVLVRPSPSPSRRIPAAARAETATPAPPPPLDEKAEAGPPPPAEKAEAVPPPPAGVARAGASAAEQAFAAGWTALLGQHFARAAESFSQAAAQAQAGGQPIAEDARYWQGVALARAGRPQEAIRALSAFLARYPRSPRAAEGSSILGWLLLRTGPATPATLDEAERLFQAASQAPLGEVRESARAGLAAIAARRAAR